MNFLDQFIGYFSPQRGMARARARMAMRVYEAATTGRRASSFRGTGMGANSEISGALRPLRDRARELVRNTPHAKRAIDIIRSHAVGVGLRPVSRIKDTSGRAKTDVLDNKVMDLWEEWNTNADVEGRLSFYAMQAKCVAAMIQDGEVVLRLIDKSMRNGKSGPVPLQIQLLESDFIDEGRDGVYRGSGLTADTVRSRLGVGLGEFDVRTGLWLFPEHPGDYTTMMKSPGLSNFTPMEDLIHLFRDDRPGQVRGVTWLANVVMTARDLADFLDAVTVKARVEACFSAFVTNSDDLEPILDTNNTLSLRSTANPDMRISTLEPGMVQELKQGQDIKFAQPTSTSQVESVLMFNMMQFAAGIGVTYDQLAGDLRQANYSSLRAGGLQFRRQIEQFQWHVLVPMLCEPVWNRFIRNAILSGKLTNRSEGYPANWVTPAWDSVNPKFDQDAEERSVRAGRMTPQEYYASWGGDWRKNIDQIAEFNAYCDEKKVTVDIDVRQITKAGSMQPQPKPGTAGGNGFGGAPEPAAPPSPQANGGGGDQTTQLFDADGNEIDLSDLQDMLDAGRSGQRVVPFPRRA